MNNDDKNIPLSVAEAQVLLFDFLNTLILKYLKALTCYGSGEDEESIKSNEDLPKPEMKTELKAQSEGSTSSRFSCSKFLSQF